MSTNSNSTYPSLLVVDDEPDFCAFVAQAAEELGFDVNTISELSSLEIISAHIGQKPTAVLLDLSMPNHDGVEIIRYLSKNHKDVAIGFMTGVSPDILAGVERLTENLGFYLLGAIQKPFGYKDLNKLLQKAKGQLSRNHYYASPKTRVSLDEVKTVVLGEKLCLYFQPKVYLDSQSLCGVEGLVRWPKGDQILAPASFLPQVEKLGLMPQLTRLVFKLAVKQAVKWKKSNIQIPIAINLSACCLNDLSIPDFMSSYLRSHGLDAEMFTIEITESASIASLTDSLDIFSRLRLKGFHLSIDDFGTGYSSLYQLTNLPFNELKLDRTFTVRAPFDESALAALESAVVLSERLGMRMVAEGIENKAVLEVAQNAGVKIGQGYLFSRPLPSEQLEIWLQQLKIH